MPDKETNFSIRDRRFNEILLDLMASICSRNSEIFINPFPILLFCKDSSFRYQYYRSLTVFGVLAYYSKLRKRKDSESTRELYYSSK